MITVNIPVISSTVMCLFHQNKIQQNGGTPVVKKQESLHILIILVNFNLTDWLTDGPFWSRVPNWEVHLFPFNKWSSDIYFILEYGRVNYK